MTFADAGPAMPQFKAGKLRPLASTGATRLPELPDVPTLAEVGIDGVVVEGFIGLAAPKGTPAAIVKKLEAEVMAIAKLPEVQGASGEIGLIPDGSTGAAFHDRIAGHSEIHRGREGREHQVRLTGSDGVVLSARVRESRHPVLSLFMRIGPPPRGGERSTRRFDVSEIRLF